MASLITDKRGWYKLGDRYVRDRRMTLPSTSALLRVLHDCLGCVNATDWSGVPARRLRLHDYRWQLGEPCEVRFLESAAAWGTIEMGGGQRYVLFSEADFTRLDKSAPTE